MHYLHAYPYKINIILKVTTSPVSDVFEKKFASDSAKAKSNFNFVKDFFPLKSKTEAH